MSERFWKYVEKTNSCWLWNGFVSQRGYGSYSCKRNGERRSYKAHRLAYEMCVGPIPSGRALDHLCRNRKCVRPDHLEPVTWRENTLRGVGLSAENARKTHCVHGHPFDDKNTIIRKNGDRLCRQCIRRNNLKSHRTYAERIRLVRRLMRTLLIRSIESQDKENADE